MKNLCYFVTISIVIFYSSLNAQWIQTNGPYVGDVCTFAVSGTNLFAGTTDFFVDSGGVFLSTNNGTNWIATGFQDTLVSALTVSGTNLFAGTSDILGNSGGVFLSTNNGINWTAVNTGLPNTGVLALAVSGTNLFAGTSGSGVWRRPLSEITSVSFSSTRLPQEFTLEQNYPNPFNPSTRISWQLPISSHVSLKVFDVLGNEIAKLVNEEKPAGSNEIEFDAGGLPSGIYFYRLQAGKYIETKKLVLLK